jgi:hypothetical protein
MTMTLTKSHAAAVALLVAVVAYERFLALPVGIHLLTVTGFHAFVSTYQFSLAHPDVPALAGTAQAVQTLYTPVFRIIGGLPLALVALIIAARLYLAKKSLFNRTTE